MLTGAWKSMKITNNNKNLKSQSRVSKQFFRFEKHKSQMICPILHENYSSEISPSHEKIRKVSKLTSLSKTPSHAFYQFPANIIEKFEIPAKKYASQNIVLGGEAGRNSYAKYIISVPISTKYKVTNKVMKNATKNVKINYQSYYKYSNPTSTKNKYNSPQKLNSTTFSKKDLNSKNSTQISTKQNILNKTASNIKILNKKHEEFSKDSLFKPSLNELLSVSELKTQCKTEQLKKRVKIFSRLGSNKTTCLFYKMQNLVNKFQLDSTKIRFEDKDIEKNSENETNETAIKRIIDIKIKHAVN